MCQLFLKVKNNKFSCLINFKLRKSYHENDDKLVAKIKIKFYFL